MKPLCEICETRHENYQAHVFATNRIATNKDATNRTAGSDAKNEPADSGCVEGVAADPGRVEVDTGGRTANRRGRAAYNAYQREYMRKRRLKVVLD